MNDGEKAATKAIARVKRHANPLWVKLAMECGRSCARRWRTITSQHVADLMALAYPGVKTHDGRAMGHVMRALAAEGTIKATNQYVRSGKRVNHNRPMRIWEALP